MMQPERATSLPGTLLLLGMTLVIVASAVVLLSQRNAAPEPIALPSYTLTFTPTPTQTVTPSPPPTATPTAVLHTVYVTGAVAQPNHLHTLPDRSRIGDAVAAAGGALPEADLARVNLAAFVRDGEQIHIPTIVPTAVPVQPYSAAPSASSTPVRPATATPPRFPIRLNLATREELMAVPGIGAVLADRILVFRNARGRIPLPDMLLEVQGIGPAKLSDILPYLSFD
jgi:competence protein ComEA